MKHMYYRPSLKSLALLILSTFLIVSCAAPSTQLVSTTWVLTSLDGNTQVGEALGGQPVTLGFTSSTEAGGSGGCNSFGAQYEAGSDGTISFSQVVSTLMACTQEGIGDVETAYLDALNSADHYEVAGTALTITGGGHTLVFERQEM
jgi:heat shock protein HslJ